MDLSDMLKKSTMHISLLNPLTPFEAPGKQAF